MPACTATELIEQLRLLPHPEGGWFLVTPVEMPPVSASALPPGYSGARESASLIYYLLQKGEVSRWHQLRSAEMWLWHCGGGLEMTLGGTGPLPAPAGTLLLGSRLADGERFQILAPANQWQTTRLVHGEFALVSCVVSPAFHDDDCYMPLLDEQGRPAESR